MRDLAILTFLTLDGVMQAPGSPGEDPSGEFKYGGWAVNYWDDVMENVTAEAMAAPYDLLLAERHTRFLKPIGHMQTTTQLQTNLTTQPSTLRHPP